MEIDPKVMYQSGLLNPELTLTLTFIDAGWTAEEIDAFLKDLRPVIETKNFRPWPDADKRLLAQMVIDGGMKRLGDAQCRDLAEQFGRSPNAVRTMMDSIRYAMIEEQNHEGPS